MHAIQWDTKSWLPVLGFARVNFGQISQGGDASICFLYPSDFDIIPDLLSIRPRGARLTGRSIGRSAITVEASPRDKLQSLRSLYFRTQRSLCMRTFLITDTEGKLVRSLSFYGSYREHMKRHIVRQIAVDCLENPRSAEIIWNSGLERRKRERAGSPFLSIKCAACSSDCLQQEIKIVLGLLLQLPLQTCLIKLLDSNSTFSIFFCAPLKGCCLQKFQNIINMRSSRNFYEFKLALALSRHRQIYFKYS